MKKRFRVSFSVEVDLPAPFIDKDGKPHELLLLKGAAYRISREVAKPPFRRVTFTIEPVEPVKES